MRLRRALWSSTLLFAAAAGLWSCAGDGEGLTESGDPAGGELTMTVMPSKDNTLYEDPAGTVSNGAGAYSFVGVTNQQQRALRRAIIAFDVAASLPPGATVTSVELNLFMSKPAGASGPVTIALHRCQGDWGEGTSDAPLEEGGGTSATTGDATWIHRFFSSETWTAAGGDFEADPSASQTVDAVGAYAWTGASLTADVQSMLDTPAGNFGWVVMGDESRLGTSKRFDTRENPDLSRRPKLVVRYTEDP